jgi:hypothetical protein
MGTVYSSLVRAGPITYFIDVDEDHQGKKTLVITEARMTPEAKKHIPVIHISAESVALFGQAVSEAVLEILR